jgi:ADP-heptose:LPS heptosyltransferase
MGVDADQTRVEIAKPAEAPPVHSAIVLHVGGKDPRKRLPVEHFVEMFRGLELDTATTVVTGDARDKRAATLLATAAGLPEQNVLAGRLTIQKWAATIANARLVITGDTGAAHLSTAFHVPSVVVFGPESPARWGPPESARHRTLRATGPRPIAGDVSTARVVRAARELLEAS